MLDRGGDGHVPVEHWVAHRHVPLPCYQHRQEHGGAEAHVVEGVGELGYEVGPYHAVLRPWPGEFCNVDAVAAYDAEDDVHTSGKGVVNYGEDDKDDVDGGEGNEEAIKEIVCLEF